MLTCHTDDIYSLLDQIEVPKDQHDYFINVLKQIILAHNRTATWTAGVENIESEGVKSDTNSPNVAALTPPEESEVFKILAGFECKTLIRRISKVLLRWERESIDRNLSVLRRAFELRNQNKYSYSRDRELLLLVYNATPEFQCIPPEILYEIGKYLPYSVRGGLSFGWRCKRETSISQVFIELSLDPKKFFMFETKEDYHPEGYKRSSVGTWEVIFGPKKDTLASFPSPEYYYDGETPTEELGNGERVFLVLRADRSTYQKFSGEEDYRQADDEDPGM
jgi:hypothetical protein